MISMLSLFVLDALHHYLLEEIKLIAIINWIFHVSDFLRIFMMSFKYGLISSRYSLTDTVLSLLHFFHIIHNYCLKNCLLLRVSNNLLTL